MIALLIVVALVIAAMIYLDLDHPQPSEPAYLEDDLAGPYREGLQAAARIQQAAWLAEQQLYAEAFRYANFEPASSRPDEDPR